MFLCEHEILHEVIYLGPKTPNSCSPDLCGDHPAPQILLLSGLYDYHTWIVLDAIVFLGGRGKLGYLCESSVAGGYL